MRSIGLLLCVFLACNATLAWSRDVDRACDAAAVRAERDWSVPAGVLSAVGTVESGHQHGPFASAPWPWTINAAGRGSYFQTKAEAIAAVLGLMQRGYPFIDIGCFQIDIAYHPDVFRSLDDAFDPERNAQAAARILAMERTRAPNWAVAVARYHSATPELGESYLQRVRSALAEAKLRGLSAQILQESDASPPGASKLGPDGTPSRTLPRVIYPPGFLTPGREPQILFVGALERLPRVINGKAATQSLRR